MLPPNPLIRLWARRWTMLKGLPLIALGVIAGTMHIPPYSILDTALILANTATILITCYSIRVNWKRNFTPTCFWKVPSHIYYSAIADFCDSKKIPFRSMGPTTDDPDDPALTSIIIGFVTEDDLIRTKLSL